MSCSDAATPSGATSASVSSTSGSEGLPQLPHPLAASAPSRELLLFFQEKLCEYERAEEQWLSRVRGGARAARDKADLAEQLDESRAEVRALQRALADMQSALAMERKRAARVAMVKDRMHIVEMENRRKILLLLEICGKTDSEISALIAEADRENLRLDEGGGNVGHDVYVPQKVRHFLQVSKRHPSKIQLRRSNEGLRMEILTLEHQLLEQEKCHMEQVSTLENERRLCARDQDAIAEQYEARIKELSEHVKTLDSQQDELTTDLAKTKTQFRRCERNWMLERDSLQRKVQYLQTFGGAGAMPDALASGGGLFTEHRAAARQGLGAVGAEAQLRNQIQKLNTELSNAKNLTETYKAQLLAVEVEMEALREQSVANRDILKRRTKAMVDQVESLKERHSQLEKRKRSEAEGYQQDIKLLRQKVKKVEQQLARASITKAKEHDYLKALSGYEKEVEELRRRIKKNPQWID